MCNKPGFENEAQTANGRGQTDRPDDPLFPLMPRVLEALRKQAAEAAQGRAERAGPGEAGAGGAPDEYAMLIETICGATDDSQPVEQYDGTLGVTTGFVSTHQSAVGQIQWNSNLGAIYTNPGDVSGQRWCSGTLVANDLFLTAGHCFDQTGGGWQRPRTNGTSNIISSAEIAQNMHVNFNYQVDPSGNLRTETSFAITQLVEYRLGGLDFAIVRLAGNPGTTWGRANVATTDATAGQMLCIIGHPAGLPKRIEAGPALTPSGNMIRYDDVDTLGGNSGSGVLRASDGSIVGVHTNGGCGPSSPNGTDANFGQRIAALIAASPTLQTLTTPTAKFTDDLTTSLAADLQVTLKGADDIGTTIKFTDDLGTSLAADLQVTFKGSDDVGPTIKFTDDLGTSLAADLGATLKFRDDVKQPGFDKNPAGDAKLRGFDGRPIDPRGPLVNPGIGAGGGRPFILSTPHHSMAWAGEQTARGPGAAEYEAALAELGAVIAQKEAELQALDGEYRQMLADYQALGG